MIADAVEAELALMKVAYKFDMVSFELIAGFHPSGDPEVAGTPVILIRNKLEDSLSCLISQTPIEDGPDLGLDDLDDEEQILNDLRKVQA